MPVLYNNQSIILQFDISMLDNIYQPYLRIMYAMTLVSKLWMTILLKYFLIENTIRQMNWIRATETLDVYPVYILLF